MHTFFQRPEKKLKMHRLKAEHIGQHKVEMLSLLRKSCDPFASVEYTIAAGHLSRFIRAYSSRTGRRITFSPVANKLLALAIAENPEFNQIVFGSSAYQLEEIHIANTVLVPGTDIATYVMLENPHTKPLELIQQELFSGIESTKSRHLSARQNPVLTFLTNISYRWGLYRLVGQRIAFTMAFERGLISNITLSSHVYSTPANFVMRKDILPAINMGNKFHLSGPAMQPAVDKDAVTARAMLSLFATTDHRLVYGLHSYRFGQSLKHIAENPDGRL
jgi:pyruvate/2-oxoglutarate dehydrogenase complex dihydrolipoamide acyltransferase (E2) component